LFFYIAQPEPSELNSGDEAQASSTSEIPEVIQDVVEIPEEAQASVNEETNRISNTCDKNNAVSSKSEEKVEKAVNQTDDEEVFNMKEVQEGLLFFFIKNQKTNSIISIIIIGIFIFRN
jgi:hypothetical protein